MAKRTCNRLARQTLAQGRSEQVYRISNRRAMRVWPTISAMTIIPSRTSAKRYKQCRAKKQ